jgi:hypothetical protein
MARIDLATTAAEHPGRPSPGRRRWAWFTIGAVTLVSGSALLAVPAIAADGGSGTTPQRVIVCESPVVSNDGVETSSAVAERLPAGDTRPVPEGCREG